MSPIVKLTDVSKSFGTVKVLHSVSFEVNAGQVVALIGRSGSGKSTALRCINGLEKINGGEVAVCDHHLHQDVSKKQLRKLHLDVGMVFQSYNLFPHLTVGQNIMLAPRFVKSTPRKE
ncbi:amino acid ABC transporter ATP-binding protein [Brucella gallinifaecis]|uniref:Amino acid ABC transporter ATP-binding protein n=1 Tax=Brucella gallinifaecis TaxID=215590 RepID=A0A502BLU8_9HYPH|nr:amino acid ABC transporter ATP-binding protein [Brucella gallinifaecis]